MRSGICVFPNPESSCQEWPTSSKLTKLNESSLRLSLIPSDSVDVAMNTLIHTAAYSGTFSPLKARSLLGFDALAIALPRRIQTLLGAMSHSTFEGVILEILSLIADDEGSHDSIAEMLDGGMFSKLKDYERQRSTTAQDSANPDLVQAVETLLSASRDWYITIPVLHVIAPDAQNDAPSHGFSEGRRRRRQQENAQGMWSTFSLWRLVRDAAERKGLNAKCLSFVLHYAMSLTGRRHMADARSVCLRLGASSRRHCKMKESSGEATLYTLPTELVEQHIMPMLFLAMLESMYDNKR